MKCEYCTKDHNGNYGSGRFCNAACARGFSTKSKRKEISTAVSKKLKGCNTKKHVPAKEAITKICLYCGAPFKTIKEHQKFCSASCERYNNLESKIWTIDIFKERYGFTPDKLLYNIVSCGRHVGSYRRVTLTCSKRKTVLEHRMVMEHYLQRYLLKKEVVHHIDEDPSNNHITNLKLLSYSDHNKLHKCKNNIVEIKCAYCGSYFFREKRIIDYKKHQGQVDFYCNNKCSNHHFGRGRLKDK